jgi:hypothetical protein
MAHRNGDDEPAAKRVCAAASADEEERADGRKPQELSEFTTEGVRRLTGWLRRLHPGLGETAVQSLTEPFEKEEGWDTDPIRVAMCVMAESAPGAFAQAQEWVKGLGALASELGVKELFVCMMQFLPAEERPGMMTSIMEEFAQTNFILADRAEAECPLLVYRELKERKYREVDSDHTVSDGVNGFVLALWSVVFDDHFPDNTRFPVLVNVGRHLAALEAQRLLRGRTADAKALPEEEADALAALVDQNLAVLHKAREHLAASKGFSASEAEAKRLLRTLYNDVDEEEWGRRPVGTLFAEAVRGGDADTKSDLSHQCFQMVVFTRLEDDQTLPEELVVADDDE